MRGVAIGSIVYTVFTAAFWILILLIAAASPAAAQRPISMPVAAGSQQSIDEIRENIACASVLSTWSRRSC